ncbi:unnamed protein product [Clavelina lepadiformis]|uniref:Uncharacterized protein n=1 Tax=Clavelina lepadiformis TaxID=159417 RepID=A0ABP0H2M7_CLALP
MFERSQFIAKRETTGMSSKHFSEKSRSKAQVAQYRRRWLKSELDAVKNRYEETLRSFERKIDAISSKAIKDAEKLLNEKDDDHFLKSLFIVEQAIYECTDGLIEMQFSSSSPDSDISEDYDYVTEIENETILQVNKVSSNFEDFSCKSFEIPANYGTSYSKSSFTARQSPSEQLLEVQEALSSLDTDDEKYSKKSDKPEDICSKSGKCHPDNASKNITKLKEMGNLQVELSQDPIHEDLDLVLLNNISYEEQVSVVVTDVTSPSLFSLQIEKNKHQLTHIQQEINYFYSQSWAEQLQIKELPNVGTICVALFVIDHCWYRARVTDVLQMDKIKVMYIDYGNTSEVRLRDLRRISPEMAEVPQLSIQCSLFGVEPPASLSSADNPTKWPLPAIKWFDAYVFGNQFIATFLPNKCNPSNYTVHLFRESDDNDENGSLLSVADRMVCAGFAYVNGKPAASFEEAASVTTNAGMDNVSTMKEQKQYQENVMSSSSNNCSRFTKAIPAGMERTHFQYNPRSNCNLVQEPNSPANVQQRLTCLEPTEQENSIDCETFEALNERESLHTWNPMTEDFKSHRNNYSTDISNACVAIEHYNPNGRKVCKFFSRGNCWKGKNCRWPHIWSESDVLHECKVLSSHTLEDIFLLPDEVIVVKIVKFHSNSGFYAQILGKSDPHTQETNWLTSQFQRLTCDMKAYYSKNRQRFSLEHLPSCGEMCAVVHSLNFCRATVTQISNNNGRVKVYLVDYGISQWVDVKYLLPFCQAFMHLPRQAFPCTYDALSSDVKPVRSHAYSSTVGHACSAVDSPVPLTIVKEVLDLPTCLNFTS